MVELDLLLGGGDRGCVRSWAQHANRKTNDHSGSLEALYIHEVDATERKGGGSDRRWIIGCVILCGQYDM